LACREHRVQCIPGGLIDDMGGMGRGERNPTIICILTVGPRLEIDV